MEGLAREKTTTVKMEDVERGHFAGQVNVVAFPEPQAGTPGSL